MKDLNLPTELVKELQEMYNSKKATMFQIISTFTTVVGKRLTEKGYTMEEKAEFFKSEAYNNRLEEFKSNFTF